MDTPSKTPRQPATPSKGTAKSAQGKATGNATGAKNTASQKSQAAKGNAKQQTSIPDDESEAATEGVTEAADSNGDVDDVEDAADDGEQAVEGATGANGEDDEGDEAEEDGEAEAEGENDEDGDEIVPAGKVGDDGKSVLDNEGSVIGSVSGKGGKKLAGQVVDQEGDIVDQSGNVLGQAEPSEAGQGAKDAAGDAAGDAGDATEGAQDAAKEAGEDAEDTAEGAQDAAGGLLGGLTGAVGGITNKAGGLLGNTVEGVGDVAGGDVEGGLGKTAGGAVEGVEGIAGEAGQAVEGAFPQAEGALSLGEGGLVDSTGKLIGQVPEELQDTLKDTPIKEISPEGQIIGEDGGVLGKALPPEVNDAVEGVKDTAGGAVEGVFPEVSGLLNVTDGNLVDETGKLIGHIPDDLQSKLKDTPIKEINSEGEMIGENGDVLGKALPPEAEEAVDGAKDTAEGAVDDAKDTAEGAVEGAFPQAEGMLNATDGQLLDEAGNHIGDIPEDLQSKLEDTPIKEVNPEGEIIGEDGNVLGKASPPTIKSKFPKFRGLLDVDDDGNLKDGKGRIIGSVPEDLLDDVQGLSIKEITPEGDMIDEDGNNVGKANPPEPLDYSVLDGAKVTKTGKVVDDNGNVVGNLKKGNAKSLEGKPCDENGVIWDDRGKKAGQAEPLPKEQLAENKVGPFDDFEDAKVAKNGDVISNDQVVGKVVEGDPKKLAGKAVDSEGSIVDKNGNVLGRAERYEEPEEEVVDQSALAGKRVNKAGNVVDTDGSIIGRVVEGDPKKLAGKMCGKTGEIFDEGGNVLGRAEIIPPSEREGSKEGPFSAFQPCTVKKDGTVVGQGGNIVGRLTQGDPKTLEGRQVDQDGDITDSNGNSLGKAERWEPEEKPKDVHPAAGLKINKEGNVVDKNGDTVAKLTSGELNRCRGKEIDDDGDVVDQKGTSIGSVTMIEDLKPEKSQEEIDAENKQREEEEARQREEEEKQREIDEKQAAEDEKQAKEEEAREKDKKLAKRLCFTIDEKLEKLDRICRAITDYVNDAEQTPKEELDEEQLVKNVRPLIEEGGAILDQTNKEIRNLDPDGRMQMQAKTKAGEGEATPEEHRLAEMLKQLTGTVTETIDNAKRKIAGMPHASKELNPLWGLLSEPLFQILAAVGLLLSGVLGLVGKLLGGLGLGNLVGGVLGSLGLDKLLNPGGKGKKSGGGGLPGGLLGGLTGKK